MSTSLRILKRIPNRATKSTKLPSRVGNEPEMFLAFPPYIKYKKLLLLDVFDKSCLSPTLRQFRTHAPPPI